MSVCEEAKWSLTALGAVGTEPGNLLLINESTGNLSTHRSGLGDDGIAQ